MLAQSCRFLQLLSLHTAPRSPSAVCNAPNAANEAAQRNALSFRVREALLEADEQPYNVGYRLENERPIRINLDLLVHRGRVLSRRGQREGAIATYQRCIELDPLDGRAFIALAKLQEKAGLMEEPAASLQLGLRWNPDSAHLLQAYGSMQERRGLDDDALHYYGQAVRVSPSHAPAWVAIALMLQRRRKGAAGWRCLQIARSVAPRSYFVWQVVGQWHRRAGELSSAREAFRRSLELNAQNVATLHAWGVLEWRCGHVDLAAQLFQRGMQIQPHNKYVLQSWSCMEAKSGSSQYAAELFATAKERKLDGALWQARAMQHKAEGRIPQARRAFEAGIACEASHMPLYNGWGIMEDELANVTAARQIFQRGVWVAPTHPRTVGLWTSWALLEERQGDAKTAREYLRNGLRADRFSVSVRSVWAAMEARYGDYGAARQLFEDALRIDPANANVWAAYEEMERAARQPAAAARVSMRATIALQLAGEPAGLAIGGAPLPTKGLEEAARAAQLWVSEQQSAAQSATSTAYLREEYGDL